MDEQVGLYLHIPFCERKCTYCNFNTTDYIPGLSNDYVSALTLEIAWWGSYLAGQTSEPALEIRPRGNRIAAGTIYFGGGTPSILNPEQIHVLIDSCRNAFELSEEPEVTIEINPGTFERSKLEEWLAAGINRASVGVQSFIDTELVDLSRTHTARSAKETVESLRAAGFANMSLDLIAGLPDQTLAGWRFNLEQAIALRPEHLSLYLLEIKEGTQLFSQVTRGSKPRPDDDLAAEMYRMICSETKRNGYEHYEISNFALRSQDARFRSRHNLKYWEGLPVLGFGCGAHSFDGRVRWANIRRTETYIERVRSVGHAVGEQHTLSSGDVATEALFMGLRLTQGINLLEFADRFGVDALELLGAEVNRLSEADLVEVAGGTLRLTEKGLLLSNEVFVSFV